MNSDPRPKTILCDIDGTLVKHYPPYVSSTLDHKMELLPGTLEKLAEWDRLGYNIVLITGRKESLRYVTEQQLASVGIFYDQLIMGVGGGIRVLINDSKPNNIETAYSINIKRNEGLSNINI